MIQPDAEAESVRRSATAQDDYGMYAEPNRARIEPGEYEAICYKVESGRSWGGRLDYYLLFRIYGGKSDGTELYMAIPKPQGKLTHRTKMLRQWMLAMQRPPKKGERVSTRVFPNRMYRVLVRYSETKFRGTNKLLPEYMQYSVVDTIVKAMTGVPPHD